MGGPVAIENPLFVPALDREFLWNQAVDAVDDYFRIEREERVRLIGGVLTEGRIDTFPITGSTIFEPWRKDSTPGYEKMHATLQSIRRRAAIRVIPVEAGYLLDVAVQKELEDLDKPEHATAGGATLRHDGTLVRQEGASGRYSVTLGWIPLGRDVTLEQRILADLRARLDLEHLGAVPAVEEVQTPRVDALHGGAPVGPELLPPAVERLPAPWLHARGGQLDRERRPFAHRTMDCDAALMGVDDLLAGRQAQARAAAATFVGAGFGREKGFENARELVGGNAAARVADGQLHQLAGGVVMKFDQQPAAVGHRLAGVDEQIDEHLLNLIADRRNFWHGLER